jgi:hypothetical protein
VSDGAWLQRTSIQLAGAAEGRHRGFGLLGALLTGAFEVTHLLEQALERCPLGSRNIGSDACLVLLQEIVACRDTNRMGALRPVFNIMRADVVIAASVGRTIKLLLSLRVLSKGAPCSCGTPGAAATNI